MTPILPVIAAATAVLVRNTAAAITSVMALIFAPLIFGPLFPEWWQENVLSYLLGPATDSISIGHLDPDEPTRLGLGVAIVVVAAWVAAFIGVAYATLVKRDA
jgi:ABC-2 type transport system permease protein